MSWEAWGTPPDPEPELCPLCDSTCHTPEQCEVAASEARSRAYWERVMAGALKYQLDELRRAVCGVGIVGSIDGHDAIRRLSVIDLIDQRSAQLKEQPS
jgi:hypothetical protein